VQLPLSVHTRHSEAIRLSPSTQRVFIRRSTAQYAQSRDLSLSLSHPHQARCSRSSSCAWHSPAWQCCQHSTQGPSVSVLPAENGFCCQDCFVPAGPRQLLLCLAAAGMHSVQKQLFAFKNASEALMLHPSVSRCPSHLRQQRSAHLRSSSRFRPITTF
jgi:hypothetical protein